MKPLNTSLVLDPMWLCQGNYIDLEYYTYVIMGARKKYIDNLEFDFFNFYEIAFHYLNLNTLIADKKLYDSQLVPVRSHKNIVEISSQLEKKDDTVGKSIVKMAASTFGEVLQEYLRKEIMALENLHFHFNNKFIHKQDTVYIVCKSAGIDKYEIFKLNTRSKRPLGYTVTHKVTLHLPLLKNNEFKERLLLEKPTLKDFDPDSNVLVVSGASELKTEEAISIAKDLILLNRVVNKTLEFDANVLLDYNRLLEKRKMIPYKFKV